MRAILINSIISIMNGPIKEKNKRLCEANLYDQQIPLHGANMFFKLAFLTDEQLNEIAKACGL